MRTPSRVLRALARAGLDVTSDGSGVLSIRAFRGVGLPPTEVLLGPDLPVEAKAFAQLAALASVTHPAGGRVRRCCATPDLHPGDAGIAIGSVVQTEDLVIPQAVGSDINCGMRLHTVDLDLDRFLASKEALVAALTGDYLFGTREVAMSAGSMRAMFAGGLGPWLDAVRAEAHGLMRIADLDQIADEAFRVMDGGSLVGDPDVAPTTLVPQWGIVADDGLGTIGRGNHFVEFLIIDEVHDRRTAFDWGLRRGQLALLIHSGSRKVGKVIGRDIHEAVRSAWPVGVPFPPDRLFGLSRGHPLFERYPIMEATAANYGFVNRALLAEIARRRLREAFGDLACDLVADIPHNLSRSEESDDGVDRWVCRKGASPAHEGQPVLIPGSMGTASYVLRGTGHPRFLRSASHGAGRARSRGRMGRRVTDAAHVTALGLDGVECVTLRPERRVEEAPAAYKPIEPVIEAQVEAGVATVVAVMRPLLTFKA